MSIRILTFDIEEWFHLLDVPSIADTDRWHSIESRVEGNTERLLELLDQSGRKATFFCLGWVARKYPALIKRVSSMGFEVATHSDEHRLVSEMTPTSFRSDLERSIKVIEALTGEKVTSYRAPGFSVTEKDRWVFETLLEFGIETDCSIFPARRAHGGTTTFSAPVPTLFNVSGRRIEEFPMSRSSLAGLTIVYSGGGYFRLLPYPVIKRLVSSSGYVMTYFHPRDFDPGQPVLGGLSTLRRFKSYVGLGTSQRKLKRLLRDFDFVDLKGARALVDWSKAPVIDL